MRTARRVIVCLLVLLAGAGLCAQQAASPTQGSVDNDVTITGSDDSLIPVPAPAQPDDPLDLPSLDSSPPPAFVVPPVAPPVAPPVVPPAPPVVPSSGTP